MEVCCSDSEKVEMSEIMPLATREVFHIWDGICKNSHVNLLCVAFCQCGGFSLRRSPYVEMSAIISLQIR